MSQHYPIVLKLKGIQVLVVGAGKVAVRKLNRFLESGTKIRVVAPVAEPEIQKWNSDGKLELIQRMFEEKDLNQAKLIFALTDDIVLNDKIADQAIEMGLWVNSATNIDKCNFYLPAEIQRGDLSVTVSTHGKCPALTRSLRSHLEKQFLPEWETIVRSLEIVREKLKRENFCQETKNSILKKLTSKEALEDYLNLEDSFIENYINTLATHLIAEISNRSGE